ncbi:hypothetical protein Tco_0472404 [Tanacetum coccineum]
MHDDLEYVKSLEKEVDELESEKRPNFSNIYDLLLEECVSKDVICSYLHSLSDLNAHTELKCMYLHKVKECECLAQKLSKQTESVNNEMKYYPVCKENASNVFRKEREQYHEIQDLKAQMQEKNIAISELKKLIEKTARESLLGLETPVRLQEEFDEEERQRIARVHEAARSFTEEEWEDIRARVEASEELVQRGVPELVADSSQAAVTKSTEAGGTKRAAEEELGQQSSKKQKPDELSQEELQQLMIIVPEEGMNIEALQTKYPIIDWEVYTEDSRILVQERFNSTKPTEDKEIEIWVELKRLFEPDADDELWKSRKHIHDITWRLYDTCRVHHVSTKDGVDIYMLVEREYPLSRGVLTQILKDQEDKVFGRILGIGYSLKDKKRSQN